jgi:GST-like protein
MLTLYGCKGCGSVVIEAMLKLCGEEFSLVRWDWDDEPAWSKFATVSVQRQVPTLVLNDGSLLTESAAIVCWLLQKFPNSAMLPADPLMQAQMYRWLIYLSVNVYVPICVGDFPERWIGDDASAQERLKAGALTRIHQHWNLLENELTGSGQYLLGDTMCALDVYAAMMSRWRPGRLWIRANCPKVTKAVEATEAHPVVNEVFTDNFGPLK